jgi:hypothetical protein
MTSSTTKRLGVGVVVVIAPLLHFVVPGAFWHRTASAIAAGLMMLFFAKEPVEDERVQDLKLKAISTAFSVSFGLTLLVNWLLNRDWDVTRDFDRATMVWRSISGFDLIILVMAVALMLFHLWRWRDATASPA